MPEIVIPFAFPVGSTVYQVLFDYKLDTCVRCQGSGKETPSEYYYGGPLSKCYQCTGKGRTYVKPTSQEWRVEGPLEITGLNLGKTSLTVKVAEKSIRLKLADLATNPFGPFYLDKHVAQHYCDKENADLGSANHKASLPVYTVCASYWDAQFHRFYTVTLSAPLQLDQAKQKLDQERQTGRYCNYFLVDKGGSRVEM